MTAEETLQRLLAIDGMAPLQPTPFLTDEPKLPVYTTRIGEHSWGQGAHPDPVVAQLKAAGEALERHCLLTPADDTSPKARYGDLEGQIDPADFFCYSEEQVPQHADTLEQIRTAEFHWAPVRSHGAGTTSLVPREFVYLDAGNLEQQRIRRESTTSGAALGIAGQDDAFQRALFELIERDAFMGAWLKNEPLVRIGALEGTAAELVDWLARYRLDCRLFDLRGDLGVPAALALTLDRSGVGPAVTAGLGAAESYGSAMSSAILESVSYRRQARLHLLKNDMPEAESAEDIDSVETRIAYWGRLERLGELPSWVDAGPGLQERDLATVSRTAEQCVNDLSHRGFRVLSTDIAAPKAREQGFEAIRVVVPELHPLYLTEAAKALYSVHHGSVSADLAVGPHPFS